MKLNIFTKVIPYAGWPPPKIILVLKLTTLLLIVALVQASGKGFSQISLNEQNKPLVKVLESIKKQSGYVFLYDADLLDHKSVTIKIHNASLATVLNECLKGFDLTYKIVEKNVVIQQKIPEPVNVPKNESPASPAKEAQLSGFVSDTLGNAISGATVNLKDTKYSTLTDANGSFTFPKIPSGNYRLVVTFIGYRPFETPIEIQGQNFHIQIVLYTSDFQLDQVQVIAYGQTTQRYNLGSVSTVTAKDIAKQPVTNILQTLEGRVPGLVVTTSNGSPGSESLTQIRGQNSLSTLPDQNSVLQNYDQPLYIIDGVPLPLQNTPQFNGASLAGAQGVGYLQFLSGLSPLNGINPADIESISVLKDADATSIYGSQGSNGVVIITTKKGVSGKDQVDVTVSSGPTTASRTVPMMNTQQYLEMRHEAIANSGITPSAYTDPDLVLFDQGKYTNWMKEFYGGIGHHTDSHISVSGGSGTTSYLVSGGYTRETYDFPGGFAENRFSLHSSFSHSSFDKRFNIDFGTDYSYDQNNSSGTPSVLAGFTLAPNFPDLVSPNGDLNWNYKGFQFNNSLGNPFAYLKQSANVGTYTLNTHLALKYQLLPSLSVGVTAGYGRISENYYSALPIASQNPVINPEGGVNETNQNNGTMNIEPQLNFKKSISKGVLTALLGGTYKENIMDQYQIYTYGYNSDALLNSLAAGSGTPQISNQNAYYKYLAGFARLNYIWDSKYVVNLTGNRDGSSNFGPDKRFGNFGSAGLGWILTEEKHIQEIFPFISFAKLSANYGISGSDGIAPYQYQPNWAVTGSIGYQGTPGYNPVNPLNPVYAWSLLKKFNEQLDLAFFKDRIYLNITTYQDKSINQLVQYPEPIQTGFNSITANAPYVVGNNGVEIALTSKNIVQQDFQWTTNFNITHNVNRLVSFPGIASSPYANTYVIGQPVTAKIVLPYEGVNPQTGVFQFREKNGTITTYPNQSSAFNNVGGDADVIENVDPKFAGGFNNTFTYKGFSLSVFFQFTVQRGPNYLYSVYTNFITGTPGSPLVNQPVALLARWQKPGDHSSIERFSEGFYTQTDVDAYAGAHFFVSSAGAYSDASYIRLKNVAFSYHLPQNILKKLALKGCTFYINAQNLFLITGYKVGDPETMSIFNIPPQRAVVAGFDINI